MDVEKKAAEQAVIDEANTNKLVVEKRAQML
jgi:hypothetical protein